MTFDDQLERYFGTRDLGRIDEAQLGGAVEHMLVDIGLCDDPKQKFALWCLLFTLDHAPDIDAIFDDDATRAMARQFMDLSDAAESRH